MSKFGKKLILWLIVIIGVLGGVTLAMTTGGLGRYYLATQKAALNKVHEMLGEVPVETLGTYSHQIGKAYESIVLVVDWDEDDNVLNEALKSAFTGQGVYVQRLWLWEEDAERLEAGKVVNKLYNQGNSSYSLFVKYELRQDKLVVISRTIPHIDSILSIINLFLIGVWLVALLIMIIVIVIYVKHMTKPLVQMEQIIGDISELRFKQMKITTGDELEALATGINTMSERLQIAHKQLEKKNEHMQQLLNNVSHELKTPIALIKAYGIGIQDEMDDGTFLNMILEQNEVMEQMVSKLLTLAKDEARESVYTEVSIVDLIKAHVKDYQVYKEDVRIQTVFGKVPSITVDKEVLSCALDNFVSNAVKYTTDGQVVVRCYETDTITIEVSNRISLEGEKAIESFWEPFYVVETSRNKLLSGTGLGLYITRKLLIKEAIEHGCYIEEDRITFYMHIKKS